ncbi:MAG: hypothetical protein ACD_73C00240G0002, partial [uncultured bacterium]
MKINKKHLLLGLVLTLAFLSRGIYLADIPPGLNRDEAALGYTAYSILKTGKDEHGKFLPISLKSFGDWKLPGYSYLAIPFIMGFDLNETAIRLPSVLAGVLTVFLAYLIAQKLFHSTSLSLLVALLIAVSPWHIFFSRVASEANMAVFFMSLGFYLILVSRQHAFWLPVATLAICSTLLIYHGNHIFTPLMFLVLVVVLRKQYFTRILGLVSLGMFIILAAFAYRETLLSADRVKIAGLLSIKDESLVYENIVKNRLIYTDGLLARIFNNKAIFLAENITHNYLKAFSAEFLFIRGGNNAQHNMPDFGNLYPFEAVWLPLGLYFLFALRHKYSRLLLLWILIAPLGSALTKDAPHS